MDIRNSQATRKFSLPISHLQQHLAKTEGVGDIRFEAQPWAHNNSWCHQKVIRVGNVKDMIMMVDAKSDETIEM